MTDAWKQDGAAVRTAEGYWIATCTTETIAKTIVEMRAKHEALVAGFEAARRLASRASDVVTTDTMGTRFRTVYDHHLRALQAALRAAGIHTEGK